MGFHRKLIKLLFFPPDSHVALLEGNRARQGQAWPHPAFIDMLRYSQLFMNKLRWYPLMRLNIDWLNIEKISHHVDIEKLWISIDVEIYWLITDSSSPVPHFCRCPIPSTISRSWTLLVSPPAYHGPQATTEPSPFRAAKARVDEKTRCTSVSWSCKRSKRRHRSTAAPQQGVFWESSHDHSYTSVCVVPNQMSFPYQIMVSWVCLRLGRD